LSKNKKGKSRETSRFFRVFYFLFSGIVGLLFRIKVVNPENEPKEGGFVVCANHISASDPVVICYAFKKHQIRYMAKKELFKIPLLSSLLRSLGAFPIDRGGSDVSAVKLAVKQVAEGKCVGIFPQGHRYPAENPRETPTKNGAALISCKNSAPIVPVYIYKKGNTSRVFKRTYVIIGKKIDFEELSYNPEASGEYSRVTDIIFDRVCALGEGFSPEEYKKSKKQRENGK